MQNSLYKIHDVHESFEKQNTQGNNNQNTTSNENPKIYVPLWQPIAGKSFKWRYHSFHFWNIIALPQRLTDTKAVSKPTKNEVKTMLSISWPTNSWSIKSSRQAILPLVIINFGMYGFIGQSSRCEAPKNEWIWREYKTNNTPQLDYDSKIKIYWGSCN